MRNVQVMVVLVFGALAVVLFLITWLFVEPWRPALALPAVITFVLGVFFASVGVRSRSAHQRRYGIVTIVGRSSGELVVDATVDRVREAMPLAVGSIRNFRLESADIGPVVVRSPWSMFTWGEVITLQLSPGVEGTTRIIGRTEPRVTTDVLNFGQGGTDLGLVFDAIEQSVVGDGARR